MLGGTLSKIVNVNVVLALFTHSSVDVKVTVAEPVAPHSSDKPMKSWLQLTSPQTFDVPGPPLDPSQPLSFDSLPPPSHSTVRPDASGPMLGATLSEIVIITVLLALFPHSSVAVKVTVVEPDARHSSDKPVKSWLQLTSPQTSDAQAPPLDHSQPFSSDSLRPPAHSTVS